ncbi:MAG: hypothetical protein CMJ94_01575 [Planctomycetes bacterium]|nr:hypothetical protein [Planctomycetota bacterium]
MRAALTSFLVMASYYVLRPVRDELSVEYRDDTAAWWLWVAGVAIVAMPIYSLLVSRSDRTGLTRRMFRFIAAGVLAFAWFSWQQGVQGGFGKGLAGSFYIAASLYPMFVVSLLWSTLSECFDSDGGKKRAGWIFAAGTVGGIVGSTIVSLTADRMFGDHEGLPPEILLGIAATVLTLASFSMPRASRGGSAAEDTHEPRRIAPKFSSGLKRLAQSPYLLGVAGYLLLFTMGSGFLYFLQRDFLYEAYPERADRREVLANMDLTVQILTVAGQALVTGALLQRIGTARVLLIMPIITVIGFVLLASMPVIGVFIGMYVFRRASNYAFAKPARELLFTVVDSEERYLTKPTLDVAVYRGGDVVASQTYEAIQGVSGAGAQGMSVVALPFAVAALPLAFWLGKQQEARAEEQEAEAPASPAAQS